MKPIIPQPAKDLSTPRTLGRKQAQRLRMRLVRKKPKPSSHKLVITRIMRMLNRTRCPKDKNAAYLWRQAQSLKHAKTSRSSKNFKMHACADQQRRRQCFVCGASTTKHCICGATFIKDHDAIALHNFVAFVYRAPVGAFDEAEDNVRLLTAFKALHKRRVVTLQGAMRLAALAGITGKTETVAALGHLAIDGTAERLKAAIVERSQNESIYRAGQYPGALGIEGLAAGVYQCGLSSSVRNVLRRLQNSTLQTHARIDALRGVCKEVTDIRIKGIHTYFAKKILEMLILLALNRLTLSCHRSDLHYLMDVYPLPKNTIKSLRAIFPSVNQHNLREAMATLAKTSGKDVTLLVPMLCWQQQEQHGKINWTWTGL